MEFTEVLKQCKTRQDVAAAVLDEAKQRVIKKAGGESLAVAESKIWKKYPQAVERYESLPVPVAKRSQPTVRVTKSEILLDEKSRRLQRLNPGMSYPSACSAVLLKEPELYAQYTREAAAGELFDMPVNKSDGGGEEDCAECSGTGTVGGRVCESCNGFGTVEPDADDEETKKRLLRKLESVDDLERRILKLEAGLKRR
jgi:hypothetical protein